MSIINQVLADLGQRKSGQPLPANGVLIGTVLAASLPTPRYTQYLPVIAIVAAVTVCVVLLWPSSGYDYTATLTNGYENRSQVSPIVEEVDEAPLKLAPQLSSPDKREAISAAPMLDELLEQPVAHSVKPVEMSSFTTQLDDVLVKDISGVVPGYNKQVRLLLSGNVSSNTNSNKHQRGKVNTAHALTQTGYTSLLALDTNMGPVANQNRSNTNNQLALKNKSSIESRKQHAQILTNEGKENSLSNRQAQQKNSIRVVTNAQHAEQVYQQALVLNAKGDLYQAIDKLKETLALNSMHLKARYTFAALLINTNQPDAALRELKTGMELQSDYAPFAKLYGRLMMYQGELDDAIAVMERARSNAQDDADYYAQLAAIYQQKGMHPEAIAYYKQALRWQSNVGVWWMGLGISLEQQKQKRDAVTAYQKAYTTGTLSNDVLGYVQSRIKSLEMWK